MNLDKLEEHIKVKYELTDINGIRIIPTDIVAFTYGSILLRGIVQTINRTTVSVFTLENKKYLI